MWLAIEFVLLFFGLVGAYIGLDVPGGPIPALLIAGAGMVAYLWRQPDFDRRDLLRLPAVRPALPRILALWAGVAVATAVTIALAAPDRLFGGCLFARRYQATRSLLAVSAEHPRYGILIFTIGLGAHFYHAV